MILQKIGNALEKGVGGLEKAGSGIGEMLAQLGGNYAPPDLDLTNRQKRGLLGARLNDMTYGPGAGPKQTPDFLNNIRANNERQRRQDIINSPETASQLAAIADPAQRAMFQSMLDTGDVSGFQSAMYNANLESNSKNAMIAAAQSAGFDEVELAMMDGMTAEQVQAFLEDYYDKEEANKKTEFDQAKVLRDDFNSRTEDFGERQDKFMQIKTFSEDPSAAGDIAMIFAYMKMLDPNSVVRESEYATAASAGPIVDARTRGLYNRLLTGTRLLPEQRADFMKRSEDLYRNSLKGYNKNVNSYTDLATNAGLDFSTQVMPNATPEFTEEALALIDYSKIRNTDYEDSPDEVYRLNTQIFEMNIGRAKEVANVLNDPNSGSLDDFGFTSAKEAQDFLQIVIDAAEASGTSIPDFE